MAKTKTAKAAQEKDFTRDFENVGGGMMVTTIHKGSGVPHTAFVPGTFYIPVLDDEGNEVLEVDEKGEETETVKMKFANGLEYLQYKSIVDNNEYIAEQKALKKGGKK